MSTPKLFDVHTHTQFAAFAGDSRDVIDRAIKDNVWLVNVGTQKDTSKKAVEIANLYSSGVYATVGLHPIHTEKSYHDSQELALSSVALLARRSLGEAGAKEERGPTSAKATAGEEEFDYEYYKNLAEDPKVVAIGECGLDYYRAIGDKRHETSKRQREAFLQQIELARDLKKPLMIHCRNAFADLIDILVAYRMSLVASGVVHFFSGTKEDAKKLIDLGFSFSFGGVLTFTKDYDEVVKYIPLELILLETDAPYVSPIPYRGKRNEPGYVVEVAKKIAEIKEIEFEEVAMATTNNALKIFDLLT